MVRTHRRHSLAVTTRGEGNRRNRFARVPASAAVPFPRPTVDIRHPPQGFDALIDWFDRVSTNLVLLEEYELEDIRRSVGWVAAALEAHGRSTETPPTGSLEGPVELRDRARILAADHEWFRTSVGQLWWFFGVVEREDHGGHRQALGQYGRVLCESVRRHRAEEVGYGRLEGLPPIRDEGPAAGKP